MMCRSGPILRWVLAAALVAAVILPAAAAPQPQSVDRVSIQGPIVPVVARYLDRALTAAEQDDALCLITLDTPGGLVETMQVMVRRILAARVPVVVYVSPAGAWAGSAGVFIVYASDVAAMAPGTNIGAAHPVTEGGASDVMTEKMANHLASYIRTLAQRRGRNVQWGEQAVRHSVSLSDEEALRQHVVDLIAATVPELLRQLSGRHAGARVLHPAAAVTRDLPMNAIERFLYAISNPTIATLLMMFGLYGIIYEFVNPGAILPGVAGSICLLLGLFVLGQLPINYAGLGLLLLAGLLFLADLKLAAHGILTAGGIIAMVLGGILLVPPEYPWMAVSKLVLGGMALVLGGAFLALAIVVADTMRRVPITGADSLLGARGEALSALAPAGRVRVSGEIWKARAARGRIEKGAAVQVIAVDRLTVLVDAVEGESAASPAGG